MIRIIIIINKINNDEDNKINIDEDNKINNNEDYYIY